MITRILAFLLHHANADPRLFKDEFYPIKKRLLNQYATADDVDIQVLEGKQCFGCGGSGKYLKYFGGYSWKEKYQWVNCYRCAGTGWYKDPSYTLLQRWVWHGYRFHQPLGNKVGPPPAELFACGIRKIDGYISKSSTAYTTEALLWLLLLYNRKAFGQMWRMIQKPMPKAVGPLVTFKRLIAYGKAEYYRRRDHLDFSEIRAEDEKPEPVEDVCSWDDDIPF